MISDVLTESASEIERFLSEFPEVYEGHVRTIRACISIMGYTREALDNRFDRHPASGNQRYFVDERVGCIAVMDSEGTKEDHLGLSSETPGVVRLWMGEWTEIKSVHSSGFWTIQPCFREEAHELCDQLNKE